MTTTWLKRNDSREVLLFFNGWGMDSRVVAHLQGDRDVVEIHDYRNLGQLEIPDLVGYEAVRVVAWSMGVWAAALLVDKWGVVPHSAIAVNGTGCPVDDHYGIPFRGYLLTERGMDGCGREKFYRRMFSSAEEMLWFEQRKPNRLLGEQVEELCLIRKQAAVCHREMKWDVALVSDGDLIFPPDNQRNWWKGRSRTVALAGGHCPFRQFDNWNLVLDYAD